LNFDYHELLELLNVIFSITNALAILINEIDYVSLTDIAKQRSGEAKDTIKYWMKNTSTL